MSIALTQIVEKFASLVAPLTGNLSETVNEIQTPELSKNKSLLFLSTPQHLTIAQSSQARCAVVQQKLTSEAKKQLTGWTLLSSPNTKLAMAKIAEEFFPLRLIQQPINGRNVHPTAIIASSAKLASTAVVGPYAVIGENVTIGEATSIGAHTVIEAKSQIGSNCMIYSHVYIGHSCHIGNFCHIKPHSVIGGDGFGYADDHEFNHHKLTHYGQVIIEDYVHVGSNVMIDRGTFGNSQIGRHTKIDNHCHLAHNVSIGQRCLITAGFICAGSTTIGNNCVFGGRASVNGHITITDNCMFAGMSAITKGITKPGKYGGYPLLDYTESLRVMSSLRHLPNIKKDLAELEQKFQHHLAEINKA